MERENPLHVSENTSRSCTQLIVRSPIHQAIRVGNHHPSTTRLQTS
jgi:hypothetical protein